MILSNRTKPILGPFLVIFWGLGQVVGEDQPLSFVLTEDEVRAAASVDVHALAETIQDLSAFSSRVPGYNGQRQAAAYVRRQFEAAGLSDVGELPFEVTSPVEKYAELDVNGQIFPVHAFWPNLVRTGTTPREGVTGPLVYGGSGTLEELSGHVLEGAVVVLEYNCGRNWLNVPALGGRAVIFIGPDDTSHYESAAKFLRTPVNVPRFYLARAHWDAIGTRYGLGQSAGVNAMSILCTIRARTDWEPVQSTNIVGWVCGVDSSLRDEVIILSAYYDSMSVVPALAPGAEQACGIAVLLELARHFAGRPPPRSILFLATSGHGLFMEGAVAFFDRQMAELGIRPITFIALDLASSTANVGAYVTGHAYWDAFLSLRLADLFAPLGNQLSALAHRTALAIGRYTREEYVAKGIERNPLLGPFVESLSTSSLEKAGVNWGYTLPTGLAHEAEVALLFAEPQGLTLSYAFITWGADRPRVDSPLDTFHRVNLDNLAAQARFLRPMIEEIARARDLVHGFIVRTDQIVDWQRQGHRAKVYPAWGRNAGVVSGRVVEFVPKKNYIPDEPKHDALVVVRREHANTYLGVRGEPIQRVRTITSGGRTIEAQFRFPNIGRAVLGRFTSRRREIEAYVLDRESGDILFAKDLGRNGELTYPTTVFSQTTPLEVRRTVVVFPCYAVDLFDLFEPRYMQVLSELRVLDGETDSEPESYGLSLTPPAGPTGAEPGGNPYYDPCAALFIQRKPGRSHRFKVLGSAGIFGQRLTLLNSSPETPAGLGFDAAALQGGPAGGAGIFNAALQAAEDMYRLNHQRIQELAEAKIVDNPESATPGGRSLLIEVHRSCHEHLATARDALNRQDHRTGVQEARRAWALASRAYPLVLRTRKEAVLSVLFYLALLLPSAFFLERLLFGYPDIKRQLLARILIFGAVFLTVRWAHPAFRLAVNPYVVLLGFVMIALAFAVLHVVFKMFRAELIRLREQATGIRNVEIGRSEAAGVAFGLGISSMRKRKVRTANTLVTLILLTFSVLSFTSVVSRNELKGRDLYDLQLTRIRAPYNGVLFRTPLYDPIPGETYAYIVEEFSDARLISPRAWYPGGVAPKESMIRIEAASGKMAAAAAVLGVTPQEKEIAVTRPDWLEGEWFRPGDRYATLLSQSIAQQLGLTSRDVGAAVVTIWAKSFAIRGILSDDFFRRETGFTDIDGEPLTPVNYAMSAQIYQEERTTRADIVAKRPPLTFTHYGPESTLVIPFQTALELGGNIRSIAIASEDPRGFSLRTLRDEVLNRLATGLFAGIDGYGYWYTSLGHSDYRGLLALSVLIAIAGLIVFNTVLGSLYERQSEIGIYTSLGLAPSHIGAFFLAESCVYAILGVLFGYLIGQLVAVQQAPLGLDALESLALNYSSASSLYAAFIVAAVVMASSIYPAWKASRLSVPELERTIQLPAPRLDPDTGRQVMSLDFPFTFTPETRLGIVAFVFKRLKEHEELTTGSFHAQHVRIGPASSRSDAGAEPEIELSATVWLAPFDWGVSQQIVLATRDTGASPSLVLTIQRLHGEVKAWQRANRRFVAGLRRHLLLWRTITSEDRVQYIRQGQQLLLAADAVIA